MVVNRAVHNIGFDLLSVELVVATHERVSLRREEEEAAAKSPDVGCLRESVARLVLDQLWRSVVQVTGVGEAFCQFLEVIWHTNHVPLDDSIMFVDSRRVHVPKDQTLRVDVVEAFRQLVVGRQ